MTISMNMNPPWKEFDRIPWGSVGWRMGFGEVYWMKWTAAFLELSEMQKADYQRRWTEEPGWEGFYAFIEKGTLPPHHLEREARTKAAARPPSNDEHEVADFDRVQWMLKYCLRRPHFYIRAIDSESGDVLYLDPEGNSWLLLIPSSEENFRAPNLVRYNGKLIGEDNLEVVRPISLRT